MYIYKINILLILVEKNIEFTLIDHISGLYPDHSIKYNAMQTMLYLFEIYGLCKRELYINAANLMVKNCNIHARSTILSLP